MHFEYTRIRADLEKHLHSRYETTSSRPLNVYVLVPYVKTGSLQSTYNVGSTKPENPTRKLDLEWSETRVFGAEQLRYVSLRCMNHEYSTPFTVYWSQSSMLTDSSNT